MKIKRIVYILLILIWMIVVFAFSNQPSDESSKTSGKTAKVIVNTLPKTKKLDENTKEEEAAKLDPYIRKIAHYSIYTLGGVLIVCFMNTYKISYRKKIVYSQIIGSMYAITDEFHQLFVAGRSAEFKDVFLDSIGVATGIAIGLIIYKIKKKVN